MRRAERRYQWHSLVFAAALFGIVYPTADAKESSVSVEEAEQYVAKGDLKAAEIELRNAIRESTGPVLPTRLAQVYLRQGEFVAAEAKPERRALATATRRIIYQSSPRPCFVRKNFPTSLI